MINSHALSDDLEKGDGSIILVCHGNRSGVSNSIYHDSTIVCSLERLVQFRLKQCVELKQRIFFRNCNFLPMSQILTRPE